MSETIFKTRVEQLEIARNLYKLAGALIDNLAVPRDGTNSQLGAESSNLIYKVKAAANTL